MNEEVAAELETFIEEWQETEENNKAVFLDLKSFIEKKSGVELDFIPRSGVTYSLRVGHENQKDKSLFAMIDVIEDAPRWLSVCFYGEMISDPDENGDFVPEGLLGEDAICFDLESKDEELTEYVKARLEEAYTSAKQG